MAYLPLLSYCESGFLANCIYRDCTELWLAGLAWCFDLSYYSWLFMLLSIYCLLAMYYSWLDVIFGAMNTLGSGRAGWVFTGAGWFGTVTYVGFSSKTLEASLSYAISPVRCLCFIWEFTVCFIYPCPILFYRSFNFFVSRLDGSARPTGLLSFEPLKLFCETDLINGTVGYKCVSARLSGCGKEMASDSIYFSISAFSLSMSCFLTTLSIFL